MLQNNRYFLLTCLGVVALFSFSKILWASDEERKKNFVFGASILAQVQNHYLGEHDFTTCTPQPYGEGVPKYIELIKKMTEKDIEEVDYSSKPYRIFLEFRASSDSNVRLGLDVFLEHERCKSFRLSERYD